MQRQSPRQFMSMRRTMRRKKNRKRRFRKITVKNRPVIVPETDDTDKEETHDPVEEITMSAEPRLPEPTRLERMLSDDRSLAARLGRERLGAVADELCYGDMETCLDMIDALEATGDFDMAVLYIQEHYPQKSDSRAIDMLVEVLSAKFI